ncbi:hypothetical protein NIES4075_32860 [Tolypothrix sp. NIES-4075]|uniref:NAD(P)/FAD-dependent oxidoreductase n=1 Tax=Tolypothrix sp. NIES-4075 TaxID=2005459 RepID=UPI000B5C4A9F|nr:NAD(P)/FAD-dependent oxidoreductase [Tolypothrix sp. NIES-4075]GAX42286.1 hypothetical protein NIES4075_32860 [Tolypothrix sp. NIES-4075]
MVQVTLNQVQKQYDVTICGAGLAGLTLARQLKMQMPGLKILLLDKIARPLPQAAFKVGESTVEVGAHYLSHVLKLTDYFEKNHYHKLGLRYFFSDASGSFEKRPEFGLSQFPPVNSYQIDRGILENDLRQFNEEAGVELIENCSVQDILLSNNDEFHQVIYTRKGDNTHQTVTCRWVIDAMGSRRLLQKKLGLVKDNDEKFNAVWFRVNGCANVNDFVPKTVESWHQRVANGIRYYSTNHLMGNGYWVWLIPLSSGNTSIGIVASEKFHPWLEFNSYGQAYKWLEKYEPVLASYLQDKKPLDFEGRRHYSYSSKQIFSQNRWACVGISGVFSDPFYSPGTDQIGFTNSVTTELIQLELDRKLTQQKVDDANLYCLSYHEGVTRNIQSGYPFFGNALVMGTKLLWDNVSGWSSSGPMMFNSFFFDQEKKAKIQKVTGKFFLLSYQMQQLFKDWATKSNGQNSFDFLDYLSIPFVRKLYERNLQPNKTEQELIDDHLASMETLEELAQVIFLIALEDTMPEALSQLPSPLWLNAWSISLDANKWSSNGLFRPKTQPRNLHNITEQMRNVLLANQRKAPIYC